MGFLVPMTSTKAGCSSHVWHWFLLRVLFTRIQIRFFIWSIKLIFQCCSHSFSPGFLVSAIKTNLLRSSFKVSLVVYFIYCVYNFFNEGIFSIAVSSGPAISVPVQFHIRYFNITGSQKIFWIEGFPFSSSKNSPIHPCSISEGIFFTYYQCSFLAF